MAIWLEPWSLWLLIGILFIGAELIIPGLVIIFFGLGAILTSIMTLFPFINNFFWLQIIIFITFSIVSLIALRKKFNFIFKGSIFAPENKSDSDILNSAEVLEPLSDKKEGRIKYKGTSWTAISNSGEIQAGKIVKILRREGLTYIVEKLEQ